MYPVCEPTARPAIITPSITACGSCSKISRSLQVPGSLSSPLHKTYFGFGACLGTNDHFSPVLNPAPAQAGILHLSNDRIRPHAQGLLHRPVTLQLQVAIEIRRTLPESFGDDLHLVGMGDQIGHDDFRSQICSLTYFPSEI